MMLRTMTYRVTGRIARITLNRPERGNGITIDMPKELATCVESANLNPDVHVIALSGNGAGFCGGYDLVESAEASMSMQDDRNQQQQQESNIPKGSPVDPQKIMENHIPNTTWDPVTDYQMMSRNVRGFMSLFYSDKPVVCKVHNFCVAGGTDMALCSDLLVVEDKAKIGYPPARVWGTPTTALWCHKIGHQRAMRLMLTGDCISGVQAVEWGLAIESAPIETLNEKFEHLLERVARVPINQLVMQKLSINSVIHSQGLANTQIISTIFDGISRHTKEGFEFQQTAAMKGFKEAVRERDEPFGDFGLPKKINKL